MPSIRVCALFRPLSSKEKSDHGDSTSIHGIDSDSFVFKDEKEEETEFHFDKVFFQGSEQADIYEFLALPIVKGVASGVNGAIITYGQISISDSVEALRTLSTGIANRAVGETQMNMASSRSHCIYIFVIQQEIKKERRYGKLILVDLAGSEKAERTGAEGRVLEEAKTINKSLSALGNVINALSSPGKGNHIPYRDSKLTRILQDALGGNSQTALLCCCSPSPSNASETLSTLRFGARAKHIKQSAHVSVKEDEDTSIPADVSSTQNESSERILSKLAERLEPEDVQLLEQLFILEGIFFNPNSVEEVESAYEDVTSRTISSLQKAVEELVTAVDELKKENEILKGLIKAC
ncbi:kinesin-like protein KIN-1 isoform X2 [Salvia miltiorrhiza]|uniref:kinesin-like protein KIN-1 isoform X2 n=1 Tax=Salvia miltiorrhiza TaxID=226208 RepID=UPI0025AD8DB7|nr:kinesin-like protein KIN-1 isoform X2 [Salvia miltiorrhiza]